MRAIRKHLSWVYAFSALACLRIAILSLRAPGHPERAWSAKVLLLMTGLASVFAIAFWTSLMEKRPARAWGLTAGSLIVLATLLPSMAAHRVKIASPLFLAVGLLAVLANAARARGRLASSDNVLPIRGDCTSRHLNRFAPGLTIGLGLAAYLGWQAWLKAGHMLVFESLLAQFVISFLVLLAATSIHELGHALAGRSFGMKIRGFIIGPLGWRLERDRAWRFEFRPRGLLRMDGATELVPGDDRLRRGQYLGMMAAGPLSNLVTALAGFSIASLRPSLLAVPVTAALALLAAWSLAMALGNLLPFRKADSYSDGAVMLQLVRAGVFAEFHLSMARISSSLVTRARPRDYDIQAIERAAQGIEQGRPALLLWLHAFCHSLDSGQPQHADEVLANAEFVCLTSASHIPAELHTTFVFGNALVRRDPKAARFWWNRLEACKPARLGADYWRALSALNWIEGDLEAAQRAWQKGNELSSQLPQAGAYEFSRFCCGLLRRELDLAAAA